MTRICQRCLPPIAFAATTGSAFADDVDPQGAVVPEPSALLIAGLCGILFLFWRSK